MYHYTVDLNYKKVVEFTSEQRYTETPDWVHFFTSNGDEIAIPKRVIHMIRLSTKGPTKKQENRIGGWEAI